MLTRGRNTTPCIYGRLLQKIIKECVVGEDAEELESIQVMVSDVMKRCMNHYGTFLKLQQVRWTRMTPNALTYTGNIKKHTGEWEMYRQRLHYRGIECRIQNCSIAFLSGITCQQYSSTTRAELVQLLKDIPKDVERRTSYIMTEH